MAAPIALEVVDSWELSPCSPFDFGDTLGKPSHFNRGPSRRSTGALVQVFTAL